jgi:hypothetical protein
MHNYLQQLLCSASCNIIAVALKTCLMALPCTHSIGTRNDAVSPL